VSAPLNEALGVTVKLGGGGLEPPSPPAFPLPMAQWKIQNTDISSNIKSIMIISQTISETLVI